MEIVLSTAVFQILRLKDYSFVITEQISSADKDYVIQSKAPGQASNWILNGDSFVNMLFYSACYKKNPCGFTFKPIQYFLKILIKT